MDQVVQLQQQIQRLQQEINNISQVCNQLQQSEQANALQLQQLTQKEMMASQGLRRIQQSAGALSQELNTISSIAQQMVSPVSPFQRTFQAAGVTPGVTAGVIPGAYTTYTGLTGQAGLYAPQAGLGANVTQPGTGMLGGAQYGTFGLGITPQFGWGQNLANVGAVPTWTQGAFPSQLQPFTQGYSPSQFGTGGQWGYSSQAFASPLSTQFGTGMQSANLGISGLGAGMQSANLGFSGLGAGQGAFQGAGLTSAAQANLGQTGMSMAAYSPYQANLYGFR